MHIRHIALRVRDLEKSVAFYETIAQLKVIRREEVAPATLAFLSNGEGATQIELIHIPDTPTFEGKGLFLCFETDALDEMHAHATTQGLSPSGIQTPDDGTRYFYVYDPDGVSVQLRSFAV